MDNTEKGLQTNNRIESVRTSENLRHPIFKCCNLSTIDLFSIFFAELIGTGLLLFLGCMGFVQMTAAEQPHYVGGLVFGFVFMLIVQCFGTVSSSHLNPAVTLCAVILEKISLKLMPLYFVAQFIGAFLGYGLLILLTPSSISVNCSATPHAELTQAQVFFVEFMGTSVLVMVVCGAWDPRYLKTHDSIAIKFGLTISALAILIGPYTGCGINPARALAPAILNNSWNLHWIYWIAPMLGSAVTTMLYKCLFWRDVSNEENKNS